MTYTSYVSTSFYDSKEKYTLIPIWNTEFNRYINTPVNYNYGNVEIGIGNINTFLTNTTVLGDNTTAFSSQINQYSVLRDSANAYIGKVKTIINDNELELFSNSNIAINNAEFSFQSFSYSEVDTDPNLGTGTISIFTSNNMIIGNNTTFTTQLDLGYQIFDNIDKTFPNFLGIIKTIKSNTEAEFTSISEIDLNNIKYRFYNPDTPNKPKLFTKSHRIVHNSLLNWAKSGLIKNIKYVQSHHAPIPDPVTGILVNFPASVIETKEISNLVTQTNSYNSNETNFQLSKKVDIIKDFSNETSVLGTSIKRALDSIPVNKLLLTEAKDQNNDEYNAKLSALINSYYKVNRYGKKSSSTYNPDTLIFNTVPSGFVRRYAINTNLTPFEEYIGPGGNIIYVKNETFTDTSVKLETVVDLLAGFVNQPSPNRIVDKKEDLASYITASDKTKEIPETAKVNLPARSPESLKFTDIIERKLTVTGLPAVIPGQLNAVLYNEDPARQIPSKPFYTEPSTIQVDSWNPDLPISKYNLPPKEF